MRDIFAKARLSPGQLRSVADRRYDDAVALRDTGKNARANGAMYLGGFVLECLLKAALLEEYIAGCKQHGQMKEGRDRKGGFGRCVTAAMSWIRFSHICRASSKDSRGWSSANPKD